jgi:hypothetical protein
MQLKQVENLFRSQSRNLVISSVFFLALVLIFQYPLVQAGYDGGSGGCVASNYSHRIQQQQNSSLEEILLLLTERYTKFHNVNCLSEERVGKKYLIYQCQKSFSGFKYCAGLGDRLRGNCIY